jgi:hypothetical protein
MGLESSVSVAVIVRRNHGGGSNIRELFLVLVLVELQIELRALYLLGKYSTIYKPQPQTFLL